MTPKTSTAFRPGQVLLQWSVGMIVSTPLIAVLQGTLLLKDYRKKYRDNPIPISPANGVAVALDGDVAEKSKKRKRLLNAQQERPLRLLVVGDSLAAGVGISKSGIPVLPQSIARALSKAYDGRAVIWTCVGTPGISTSQIVHDINGMEPELHQPRRLEILLKDWQAKRKRWQQLQDKKAGLVRNTLDSNEDETPFWMQIQSKKPKDVRDIIEKTIKEWWKKTRIKVQEDISDFKKVLTEKSGEDILDQQHNQKSLVRPGNLFRRDSVNPVVASQYDIAVVLLGLNDLKDSFMPHMTMGAEAASEDESIGSLNEQLESVVHALGKRMGKIEKISEKDGNSIDTHQVLKKPLVVVPELPIAPGPVFRLFPLCLFLSPLFRAMESNKKYLSATFPEHVVFVHQPNLKWWSELEAGVGPISDSIREEEILLKLTDIAQTAREKVQQLMKKHIPQLDNDRKDTPATDFASLPNKATDHQVEISQEAQKSSFIAIDQLHPNDAGYEVWGHHIAEAIVRHWNK